MALGLFSVDFFYLKKISLPLHLNKSQKRAESGIIKSLIFPSDNVLSTVLRKKSETKSQTLKSPTMNPENIPPYYFRPHRPHNCRRAKFHNYKAPGKYMITISKEPSVSDFSHICGDIRSIENPPAVTLTRNGEIINQKIKEISQYPEFDIPNYIIMPDHLHILWHVKKWLPRDIGHYVAYLKAQCTALWRRENTHIPNISNLPFFEPKFNDKISFSDEMAQRFSNYISDNPRKRLTVLTHPELFNRAHRVRIVDYEMDFYGNFLLLKHPIIAAAVVSSRYTPEERIKTPSHKDFKSPGAVLGE